MDTGFVLHRRRYRETSLIVEFLTLAHGRVAAVARGALGGKARRAATLQGATPLRIELTGRSELLTLKTAEAEGAPRVLEGHRLYALFYVNELIMRLSAPHDPNPALFDAYCAIIAGLSGQAALEPLLRRFEIELLEALGLGLNLGIAADSGEPVSARREYEFSPERGPVSAGRVRYGMRVRGATLLMLAGALPPDTDSLREAKVLMRHVLHHHLDGRPLAARRLFESG